MAGMARRRSAPEVLATTGDLAVLRDADRPTGRLLRQGDMDACYVDLADPRHLEFDYLRWMAVVAEAVEAREIVHVGGAGCALARALAARRPGGGGLRQEVVEIDPAVVELARAHLGLRRAPGLRVRTGDGREAIARRADASADAILVDAFVGARVPRHLAAAAALADMARVLRPGGVVAINVVDPPGLPDTRAIAAGMEAVFATVIALGPTAVVRGRRGGNVVLAAGHGPLPLARIRARAAADRSPALLLAGEEVRSLTRGTAAWSDGPELGTIYLP
jgi:spermidine synthase